MYGLTMSLSDSDNDRLLEKTLKECFKEKKDTECSVENIMKTIRLHLRRQQKCLEARSADVFSRIRVIFPQMKLRKNKRKNMYPFVHPFM